MMKRILNLLPLVAIAMLGTQANAQWSLTGNAGTDTINNFIGTTDSRALKFRTSNTQRMVISNQGRVGIGTNSPATLLDINPASGGAAVQIKSNTASAFIYMDKKNPSDVNTVSYRTNGTAKWQTGGINNDNYSIRNFTSSTTPLVITQSDNVGIGTLNPIAKLDVRADSARIIVGTPGATGGGIYLGNTSHGFQRGFPALNFNNDVGLYTTAGNLHLSTHNNTIGDFILTSNAQVGIGNSSPSERLDVTGNIKAAGNLIADGSATNAGLATSNNVKFGGIISGESIGSKRTAGGNIFGLDFFTNSLKRMAIDVNGNVGIGVDVPTENLEVSSSSAGGTRSVLRNTGAGNVGFELRSTATPSTQFIDFADGATNNNAPDYRNRIASTPANLSFSTNLKSNAMVIGNNGNVGVGTTSPSFLLSVNGHASVDGILYVRNSSNTSFQGRIQHTGSAGNLHIDTYGGTSGLFLNYFKGDAVYIGNGNAGFVASFQANGNVGIGTITPGYKLDVCGTMRATEVRVEAGWCDYVFDSKYKLRPLSEVESFIQEHKHLPEVTPGAEIESNGLEVGKVASQMIKKIEELTLYAIEQQKIIDKLQKQVETLMVTK
ncbi:MAG: hypothetical protein IPO27_16195 [Bacteroidetes bacterium]|nr:hypothetical protein [Bacteroidota bacterium]